MRVKRVFTAVFESFLLLEPIKGLEVSPHERILDPTNLASGAVLVPDPEGQEFESGHSQFRDRLAGVSAKSATDIVDLAVAELGDGLSVLKSWSS